MTWAWPSTPRALQHILPHDSRVGPAPGLEPGAFSHARVSRPLSPGRLPHAWHKSLRGLAPEQRQISKLLASILRFADALDNTHDGHVRRLQLEDKNGFLLISAAGFSPLTRTGQDVASARHLVEIVVRKPILVKPLKEPHG